MFILIEIPTNVGSTHKYLYPVLRWKVILVFENATQLLSLEPRR